MKGLSSILSLAHKLDAKELEMLSSEILQMLSIVNAKSENCFDASSTCRR